MGRTEGRVRALGRCQGNQLPSKTRLSAVAPWNFLCVPWLSFSMKPPFWEGSPRLPSCGFAVKGCPPLQDLSGTETWHQARCVMAFICPRNGSVLACLTVRPRACPPSRPEHLPVDSLNMAVFV